MQRRNTNNIIDDEIDNIEDERNNKLKPNIVKILKVVDDEDYHCTYDYNYKLYNIHNGVNSNRYYNIYYKKPNSIFNMPYDLYITVKDTYTLKEKHYLIEDHDDKYPFQIDLSDINTDIEYVDVCINIKYINNNVYSSDTVIINDAKDFKDLNNNKKYK